MLKWNDSQMRLSVTEQSMPRGLSEEEKKRAKEQIRRCTILEKERKKKLARR